MTRVSAIVPTHNRAELLAQTLRSLAALDTRGASFEVVVVANACTDQTPRVIAEAADSARFPILQVTEPLANLNRARNRGVESANGDVLALLDDDVLVAPGWLTAILGALTAHPVDILAGKVTLSWQSVDRPAWMSDVSCRLLSCTDLGDVPRELFSPANVVGANLGFKRAVFERLGGFVEGLDRTGKDLLSGGDSEFVTRGLEAGFRLFYLPRMALQHWVTPERVSLPYLERAARGRGRTLVALAALRGHRVHGLFLRGALMAVRGALAQASAKMKRDQQHLIDSRLYRLRGQGMREAAWRLLLSPGTPAASSGSARARPERVPREPPENRAP